MWEIPKYGLRAYLHARDIERRREQERKLRRLIHFKRVGAEIRVVENVRRLRAVSDEDEGHEILSGRVVLNDLNETGLKIYAAQPLTLGTKVSVILSEPRYFYVNARVVWSEELPPNFRVLAQTPLQYRIWVRFEFTSEDERISVLNYRNEIFEKFLYRDGSDPAAEF